jgi:hypothetical protein
MSVSAFGYAKLQGPDWEICLQQLHTVIGRRVPETDNVASSKKYNIDIHLVGDKISRKHAVIDYNFATSNFEISCLSKSGIKVNHKLVTKETGAVPLESRTLIKIGSCTFCFLLPLNVAERKRNPNTSHKRCRSTVTTILSTDMDDSDNDDNDDNDDEFIPPTKRSRLLTFDNNKNMTLASLSSSSVTTRPSSLSLVTLIRDAMLDAPNEQHTFSSLIDWLCSKRPEFNREDSEWVQTVRKTLELNYKRIDMQTDERQIWTFTEFQRKHLPKFRQQQQQQQVLVFSPQNSTF